MTAATLLLTCCIYLQLPYLSSLSLLCISTFIIIEVTQREDQQYREEEKEEEDV